MHLKRATQSTNTCLEEVESKDLSTHSLQDFSINKKTASHNHIWVGNEPCMRDAEILGNTTYTS